MTKIVPAILETTPDGFADAMDRAVKLVGVDRIQIDFGDGDFVANRMLPVSALPPLNPAFHWEAHLMLRHPGDFLDYKISGFSTVLVHYEAYEDSRQLHEAIAAIKEENLRPGLVINHGTPVEVLGDYLKLVGHFQIMSVVPGFQGAPFLEGAYERIAALRKLAANVIISVDGGVTIDNVGKVFASGADFAVVGSALIKSANIQEAWDKLNGSYPG